MNRAEMLGRLGSGEVLDVLVIGGGATGLGCAVDAASGEAEGLRLLRRRAYDVVLTSPHTTLSEDLALLPELRGVRPGVKVILLAPETTPEDVIAALRAHAFAVFAHPHDPGEVASMAKKAVDSGTWRDGIEVRSAQPNWLSLRVNCRLLTAERVLSFLRELRPEVEDGPRDDALADRERPTCGVRAALRDERQHRLDRATFPDAPRSKHSRRGGRLTAKPRTNHRCWRSAQD